MLTLHYGNRLGVGRRQSATLSAQVSENWFDNARLGHWRASTDIGVQRRLTRPPCSPPNSLPYLCRLLERGVLFTHSKALYGQ